MSSPASTLIKEYEYWTVSVNEAQNYLGRLVVWAKRTTVRDLADASDEEWAELRRILPELRRALTEAFSPDWFNYAFLGNTEHHLHCHLIPRYAAPRVFAGEEFVDNQFGRMFSVDHEHPAPAPLLAAIREKLGEVL